MSTRSSLERAAVVVLALVIGGVGVWALASPPDDGRQPATAQRPAMVPIAPGTFTMGSPPDEAGRFAQEPLRTVRLTRGFWMAETEVTQAQYRAVTGHDPSRFRGGADDDRRPVERVTWFDAVRYCNALSRAEGLALAYAIDGEAVTWRPDASGYRLPTAAEWEYAARAGTRTATYAGDLTLRAPVDAPVLHAIAWFAANSPSQHPAAYVPAPHMLVEGWTSPLSTHPVRAKRPNAWGLYDMLGNVLEWTWDRAGPTPETAGVIVDPRGPPEGPGRVIRGGSFRDAGRSVRAAARGGGVPGQGSDVVGFRPVRTRRR